jgi:hypothetical protein
MNRPTKTMKLEVKMDDKTDVSYGILTNLEQLQATRALITAPERFTTKDMARDHRGRRCDPYAPEAYSWCVMGAWERATGCQAWLLRKLCDDEDITRVNDYHGHAAVLAMLDRASMRLAS